MTQVVNSYIFAVGGSDDLSIACLAAMNKLENFEVNYIDTCLDVKPKIQRQSDRQFAKV